MGCSVAQREQTSGGVEVRQENAFTQQAVYVASQADCPHCELQGQCLGRGAKGNRARRESRVRRLLPSPSSVQRNPHLLGAIRWVDVAGRALRRTWVAHWRRQYVEVIPLAQIPKSVAPPPRPPRAVRQALPLELVRPARTQCVVGTTPTAHHGGFRSCIPRQQLTKEEPANTTAFSMKYSLPSELLMRAERPCLLSASSSNHPLSLYCSLAYSSLRIPWDVLRLWQNCSVSDQS
jgi:hypothetical protein